MANSTTTAGTNASTHTAGGTALHGRIEAIGVFDLLRIAVAQSSTGRLLVFNNQFDAELYYANGHLIAAVSGSSIASESLHAVLQMTEGEFEFAGGLELPIEKHDVSLHDVLTKAIRDHYQQRVRVRQESANDIPRGLRTSGVHRVTGPGSVSVSPIVNIEQPSEETSEPVAPRAAEDTTIADVRQLVAGERGRATTDASGRTTAKLGVVSPQEAALVALASKLAQNLASILGMRDLQRFEIRDAKARGLLCRVAKDSINLSCVTEEADIESVWRQLEP